jgi:hypothetical protein
LRAFWLVSLFSLLAGCHAKFKREAPTIGNVRPQIVTSGGPYVSLGHMGNPASDGDPGRTSGVEALGAIAAVAVNINQDIQGAKLSKRISQAVRIESVNEAFNQGVGRTLGQGPPFAYTNDPNANATLQIEVVSYGLNVPYIGAPGEFTYDLRVRIYKKDGERVYKARHSCSVGAGTPGIAEAVLGVVNNIEEVNEMSDAEINQSFAAMADYCATTFVVRMRRHAG